MQITLPDDPRFESNAAAAGFVNVEDYLVALLDADAGAGHGEKDQAAENGLSHEQWAREFRTFLTSLTPGNSDVDDSRESIYPVRT